VLKPSHTVTILRQTYLKAHNDSTAGFEDYPQKRSLGHFTASLDLETASRKFLELLKHALMQEGTPKPIGEEALKESSSLDDTPGVLSRIETVLGRTSEMILSTQVASPEAFFQSARYLDKVHCRVKIGDRSFVLPVELKFQTNFLGSYCTIESTYWMHDVEMHFWAAVDPRTFRSGAMTIQEAFAAEGAPLATSEEIEQTGQQTQKYLDLQEKTGMVMDIEGPVFMASQNHWRPHAERIHLASIGGARQLIVEGDLEVSKDLGERNATLLPLVRCFSPDLKKYVYAFVDDLQPHIFDKMAKAKVVLPAETRLLLDQVFDTPPERVFGDLFCQRHGGIVILASGSPGVGKTVTAEAYAESCARPLYVLGIGELGTTAAAVEQKLSQVFDRVRRWNATLLLDEGDIFLTQRTDSDIERSAIVGVFLRVLDQYQGILMITTNRPEVLDPALLSRVTIHFRYPDFDAQARLEVWKNLLKGAGVAIRLQDLEEVAKTALNGRAIRTLVRLLGICNPGITQTSAQQIRNLFQFTTILSG